MDGAFGGFSLQGTSLKTVLCLPSPPAVNYFLFPSPTYSRKGSLRE